jgi:hypothetical protein
LGGIKVALIKRVVLSFVMDIDLNEHKKLIEGNPCHIATVTPDNQPNLCVVGDIKVLNEYTILIAHNEMVSTPQNILANGNVVLTCFNSKWRGLRLRGIAEYFTKGEYFDLCNKFFKNKDTTPKGAIIVKVLMLETMA